MQTAHLYRKIAESDLVERIESIILPIGMVGFVLLLIYMPMDADLRTGYFTDPLYYLIHTVIELPVFVIGCRKIAHDPFLEFLGAHSGLFYGYQAPFIYLSNALFTLFASEMTDGYIYIFLQTAIVIASVSAVIHSQNAMIRIYEDGKERVRNLYRFRKKKGKGE